MKYIFLERNYLFILKKRISAYYIALIKMPRKPKSEVTVVVKKSAPRKRSSQYVKGKGNYILPAAMALGKYVAPGITRAAQAGVGHIMDKLGSSLKRWVTGKGDYTVGGNSLMNPSQAVCHSEAMFKPMKHGVRIAHREFVGDILSQTSAFNVTSYQVSPTNADVFPWLASLANNFEQYRILGAIWEYVPESGSISTSQALGYVGLVTEYDSNKPNFVNKSQALNTEFANVSVPCNGFLHPLECDPNETSVPVLYTSPNGNPLANENLNFVNFCNTQLIVGGSAVAGQVLGALYLNYDIELLKPRPNVVVDSPASLHYYIGAPSGTTPFTGSSNLLRNSNWSEQLRPSQITLTSTQCKIEGLPIGTILKLSYQANGAAVTTVLMTNSYVGGVGVNGLVANTVSQIQTPAAASQQVYFFQALAQTTSSTFLWNFGFSGGVIPTGGSADLWIEVVNPANGGVA